MRSLLQRLLCLLFFAAAAFTSTSFAAGGGAIGGGGSSFNSPPPAKKTPLQLAVSHYDRGIKNRDKAWRLEKKLLDETNAKKVAKLKKKVQKEFKNAAKRFRTAIKHEPRLFEAHSSLGYALRRLGDYNASLAAYNASLSLNPNYAEAIEYRGETYLALGQFEATQEAYMQLIKLDRAKADELMNAIQAYLTNPPTQLNGEKLKAFSAWATSRFALAEQTRDLSGLTSTSW